MLCRLSVHSPSLVSPGSVQLSGFLFSIPTYMHNTYVVNAPKHLQLFFFLITFIYDMNYVSFSCHQMCKQTTKILE